MARGAPNGLSRTVWATADSACVCCGTPLPSTDRDGPCYTLISGSARSAGQVLLRASSRTDELLQRDQVVSLGTDRHRLDSKLLRLVKEPSQVGPLLPVSGLGRVGGRGVWRLGCISTTVALGLT